jgi:hypothetical protein
MSEAELQQILESMGGAASLRYAPTSGHQKIPNPAYKGNGGSSWTVDEEITVPITRWWNPKTGEVVEAYRTPDGNYQIQRQTTDKSLATEQPADRAPRIVEQHTDEDGTEWTQYDDGKWVKRGPSGSDQRATRAEAAAEERRIEAEKEKADAIKRQADQQAEQNRLTQARLDAELANQAADNARADRGESRAEAAANRPTIVATSPTQRRVTQFNPATNSYEAVANPGFDEAAYERQAAKEQAQAERDRLALQIEAGKLTEATAAAQYKRWFDENVTLPIQRAQEARARAAELRAAQEAEDRRQQFAANYEQQRQTTAISAGNQAANAFNSNLQYQVGPKFGEQFAGALNSLQGGPPQQFTADAFTFKGPSIEAVARKATAKALAGISPYAQAIATAGQRDPQVASYDQSMTPAAIAPSAPPPQGTPPDYAGIINQYLQNNPYVPGGGDQEDQ